MTMAKPGLPQEQTVEEILASIRQVINGDQPRSASGGAKPEVAPTPRRPAFLTGPSRNGGTVTALRGGKVAVAGDEASEASPAGDTGDDAPAAELAAEAEGVPMHDVIEMAIEEALGGLNSNDTRAETAGPPPAGTRSPERPALRPPRIEMRPTPRETPRVEATAAREVPQSEPQHVTSREAPRLEAHPAEHEALRAAHQTPRPLPQSPSRSLLSPRANAAVAASFDDLAKVLASRGARQVDQTVEDLLRPMLKSWLEDNLPSLVERLVREEIERVSRGGR